MGLPFQQRWRFATTAPRAAFTLEGVEGGCQRGPQGSSKNERRYRDRHLSQGQQQGIDTAQARDPDLDTGETSACHSLLTHVASVTAQHEAETSHSAASSATLASSNVGCALRARKLCFWGVSGNAAPRRNRKKRSVWAAPQQAKLASREPARQRPPPLSRKLRYGLKGPLARRSGQAAGAGAKMRLAASSGTTCTRDMAAAKPRTQPRAA